MIPKPSLDTGFLYAFLYTQIVLTLLYIIVFQFLQKRILAKKQKQSDDRLTQTDPKTVKLNANRNNPNPDHFSVSDYLQNLEWEIKKIESTLNITSPNTIDFATLEPDSLELPLIMRYLFLTAEKETLLNSTSEKQYLKNIQLSFFRIFKLIESLLLRDLCDEHVDPAPHANPLLDATTEGSGAPPPLNTEEKIQYYEERINTLDNFRNLFFELQEDYDQLEQKYQTMLEAEKQNLSPPPAAASCA